MCLEQMSVVGLIAEIRKEQAALVKHTQQLQKVYEELLPYETAFTNEEEETWEGLDTQLDDLYDALNLTEWRGGLHES